MSEPAMKPMSVEEFLDWPGEGDTRYQLRNGVPVAMAPPAGAHGTMVINVGLLIGERLRGRDPCRVQTEVGLRSASNVRSYHQADLAVTCQPLSPGEQDMAEPLLIIEVLSPSTADDDRRVKLPDYRLIPSVREIMLVDSRFLYCEVHRRLDATRWLTEIIRDAEARVTLETVGLDQPLSEFYRNVPLSTDAEAAAAPAR